MADNIQKPVDLVVEDFKVDLTNLINETQLPLSVIVTVFNQVYNDVNAQYREYLRKVREEYKLKVESNNQISVEDSSLIDVDISK